MRNEKVGTKRRAIVSQSAHLPLRFAPGQSGSSGGARDVVDFAHISMGSREILEGCDRLDRGGKLKRFRPVERE